VYATFYGLGLNNTTNGVDPNNVFNYFLIGLWRQDIVTKDGNCTSTIRRYARRQSSPGVSATAYKEGFVPRERSTGRRRRQQRPSTQTDRDDLDGTNLDRGPRCLSQGKKADYDDIVTMGLALSNDGKPVPSHATNTCG